MQPTDVKLIWLRQYLVDELQQTIEMLKAIMDSMENACIDYYALDACFADMKLNFQKLSSLLEDNVIKDDPAISMRIQICLNYFQVIELKLHALLYNTATQQSSAVLHSNAQPVTANPYFIHLN
jgi:pantothenate kinase